MNKSGTAKESVDNVLWAYVSFVSTKVLNLVAIIILARYLEPAEFGIMAICLAITGYFDIVSQFGVGSALISAQNKVEETATSVAISALVASSLVAFALWSAAPYIASAYGEPVLEGILGILALALIVRAIGTVNASFLYRELRLRQMVLPDIVRGLTKGLVSIILALLDFGVWALVFGYLASTVAGAIALMIVRPWWPTRRPTFATTYGVLRFGGYLIIAETINSTPRLFDSILVGKILGAPALGIYFLAYRIPELGIKSFTTVAGSVFHPMMSKIQADKDALQQYYYGSLRYSALLMLGCGALIAINAEPLVHVLYTPKWHEMIVPMQLLALAFSIGTLNMVQGKLFKAVNRTDILFKISLVNLPFFIGIIWIAVPYGIEAVAFAQILVAITRFVPNYIAARRVLGTNLVGTFRALQPALICAIAALATGALALQIDPGSALVRLVISACASSGAYLLALRIVAPEVYREISGRLASRFGSGRTRNAQTLSAAASRNTEGTS